MNLGKLLGEERAPPPRKIAASTSLVPPLNTLRNFFLTPTAEMLTVFQAVHEVALQRINDSPHFRPILRAPQAPGANLDNGAGLP